MATVVVVGASRGIGREFVRQYTAAGDQVIATCRRAEHERELAALGATAVRLDVLDDDAADRLASALASRPIEIAILGAGLYGPRTPSMTAPSQLDFDAVMHTNVLAPMRLIPVLAPALARGRGKLAVITSRMGSVGLMRGTNSWLYRASKSAANAVLKVASNELGPQGIVCIAFHPGWVRTDMGGAAADIDVTESVSGMRRVLAAADGTANGRFLNYDGAELAW